METTNTGKINPKDLTAETFQIFCELHLTEQIWGVVKGQVPIIMIGEEVKYRHISKIVGCINPILYEGLNTETGKLLLLNQIYRLFMQLADIELYRPFLYEKVNYLASCHPSVNK